MIDQAANNIRQYNKQPLTRLPRRRRRFCGRLITQTVVMQLVVVVATIAYFAGQPVRCRSFTNEAAREHQQSPHRNVDDRQHLNIRPEKWTPIQVFEVDGGGGGGGVHAGAAETRRSALALESIGAGGHVNPLGPQAQQAVYLSLEQFPLPAATMYHPISAGAVRERSAMGNEAATASGALLHTFAGPSTTTRAAKCTQMQSPAELSSEPLASVAMTPTANSSSNYSKAVNKRSPTLQQQQLSSGQSSSDVRPGESDAATTNDDNDDDDGDDGDDEADQENETDAAEPRPAANKSAAKSDSMYGTESVSRESTVVPPRATGGRQSSGHSGGGGHHGGSIDRSEQATMAEPSQVAAAAAAYEQNEQDAAAAAAAEVSEQEAADRLALDEQRQQQREIIIAQARSEAKAIGEQQEALERQQQQQQQMLLARRQHQHSGSQSDADAETRDLVSHRSDSLHVNSLVDRRKLQQLSDSNRDRRRLQTRSMPPPPSQPQAPAQLDSIQFSDQSDSSHLALGSLVRERGDHEHDHDDDDDGQHHQRHHPHHHGHHYSNQAEPLNHQLELANSSGGAPPELEGTTKLVGANDLTPAAQHHYGAHYDSLHGHQNHYYQFAESHKKGQFDSGFKRGGKKFMISGHSSQHKSHAEGHVKWQGKKGKGVHYWDYKHKDKKHHHYDNHHHHDGHHDSHHYQHYPQHDHHY